MLHISDLPYFKFPVTQLCFKYAKSVPRFTMTWREMMRLVTFCDTLPESRDMDRQTLEILFCPKRLKLFMYNLSESLHSMDPCVQLCLVLRVEAASV